MGLIAAGTMVFQRQNVCTAECSPKSIRGILCNATFMWIACPIVRQDGYDQQQGRRMHNWEIVHGLTARLQHMP